MAFDFSTLVTDRTQQDVDYVRQLIDKLVTGTATDVEKAEWNSFTLKGAYNHTDLNRVTAAMADLKLRLESYGYAVPGYQNIEIEHPVVSAKLPDGYIELTYIESTGTQYCRIPPVNTTGDFELVFDVTPVAYATWSCLLTNIGRGGIWVGKVNTGTFSLRTYSGSNYINATPPTLNERVSVDVECVNGASSLYLNDISQGIASVAYTETATCALLSDGTTTGGFIGRLYSCQIYESGRLVHDFVPCINPNGEVGLYDRVTTVFFGNSGTGAFVSGERVGITLPAEYTRVEYIESTGTQYINTGISVPHASCKIAVKFKTRNILDRPPITGYAYSTWNWSVNMMFPYQNVFYANGGTTGIAFAANTLYNAEYTNSYVTVNGTTVQKSIANTVDGYNNTIFYGSTRYGAHLLYEYRLYNNGTLVRDMIPVIRKQDGEVGLYDLVNDVFYGNSGTGSFTAGSVVDTVLPSGYTQVEYIESSGTQYVDTGFKPNNNTRVVMDAQLTTLPTSAHAWLFGARYNTTNRFDVLANYNGYFQLGYGSGYVQVGSQLTSNRVVFDANKNVCTINGVSASAPASTFSTAYNLVLFAINTTGSISNHSKLKLYSCQIYDNGVLVRDFVPCINPSNEAGLYDMVNDVFYANAGTGTFATGNVIQSQLPSPPIDTDPYTWYEFDWPTPQSMAMYLQNVAIIRSVLAVMASTPNVPSDMDKLMVQEANDIEAIVRDVYRQITIMSTIFIPCGEALCGGDNL